MACIAEVVRAFLCGRCKLTNITVMVYYIHRNERNIAVLLENLELTKNRINALEKKGLCSVEDIQNFFPRKYYDFTKPCGLLPLYHKQYIAMTGVLKDVSKEKKNNIFMMKAKVYDDITDKKLNVIWMGGSYLYNIIENWIDCQVVVAGELTYNDEYRSFHMANPLVFSDRIERNLRVMPIYKKMSGISDEFMQETIKKALNLVQQDEVLPKEILNKYHLMGRMEAVRELHYPKSMETLTKAKQRMVYEKLYQFASEIERSERSVSKGTQYNLRSLENTKKYIESLPYALTNSQRKVFDEMKEYAYEGRRIHALIQGDVGSGKTCSAFLAMFAMADSGYQSVLMAPTQILAAQHYEKLKEAADPFGYKVAFLSSGLKKKEKEAVYEGIRTGEYTFIVGTHSVLSPDITYKNLALAVIDEEHRFGVEQRNALLGRAADGMHTISMSATPIPRTIAGALYGTSIDVYDLELPSGRKEVQTAVFSNEKKIFEFIEKKYRESGQQAYVICPWIEDAKENSGIATIEDTIKVYESAFENTGIKIGCVTGKMKPQEIEETIGKFNRNEIQILISTTVIEVGVNVPNANIIVINDAERFGLAQLHQLRGRVGRGSDQGYCILNSKDKENPRLQIMCSTTNGYEIAKKDMELRGTGDILGTDQSGVNEFIELMLQYPNMYKKVLQDVKGEV